MSPETPHGKWPLRKITHIYPGEDGYIHKIEILINGKEYQ